MKSFIKIFISFIFILLYITSCKTQSQKKKELEELIKNCNKYTDEYTDFIYFNKKLGLTLEFNSDWVINTNYENFDDFQKKYASYFSSKTGEVLFVGFNNEKKIGIRATCEELGLTNEKYYEFIKKTTAEEITNYKIVFKEENEEAIFKNIKAFSAIFEATINPNNIFIFYTVIFNKDNFNYKIDIWIKNELYETEKNYIDSIINSIDFISTENIQNADTTDDTKKEEIKK